MPLPLLSAHPAVIVPTVFARHMITSSILLNGGTAFGTRLGVGSYPVVGFRLILGLLNPVANVLAEGGAVDFLAAQEAKGVPTGAGDGLVTDGIDVHGVTAARGRAPADLRIAVDKGVREEGEVFLVNPRGYEPLHHGVLNEQVTLVARALERPRVALGDLHGEVLLPTLGAEEVGALQSNQLLRRKLLRTHRAVHLVLIAAAGRGEGQPYRRCHGSLLLLGVRRPVTEDTARRNPRALQRARRVIQVVRQEAVALPPVVPQEAARLGPVH
mmetsp:Transcript_17275/g.48587  ORF Transcript_17275/g.48587 Transcript_17275/m.48587 type:complete len:271 (+) Transcript_17275:667-1479(+)